jgi:type IX secretion system PorP/SprF family membrane protein
MRNILGIVLVGFFMTRGVSIHAQNFTLYNSYSVNPFYYNPAEAGTEYASLNINHRQQWLGMDGAPRVSSLTFTTQLDQTRAGIGFKASCLTRGILQTKDIAVSYAYGIPMSQRATLYAGLSAGAISSNIDLRNVDYSDPALSNFLANNMQSTASFGMVLRSCNGLNFGMVLPQLFTPRLTNAVNFQRPTVTPFDNVVLTAYFKRKVDSRMVCKKKNGVKTKVMTDAGIAPIEFYLVYRYSKTAVSQAEATVKLNLSQSFWVGTLYRQYNGFAGMVGFAFNKMLINYSYEPGVQSISKFSAGSHEMHIGLRLGDARTAKKINPVLKSVSKQMHEHHMARFEKTADDPEKLLTKYYVVVKSFRDFNHADEYKKKLIRDKFSADVIYNEDDRLFHVYVFHSTKLKDVHSEARNLKTFTKLKSVRIVKIEPKVAGQ